MTRCMDRGIIRAKCAVTVTVQKERIHAPVTGLP
jgi:hypothetical protein